MFFGVPQNGSNLFVCHEMKKTENRYPRPWLPPGSCVGKLSKPLINVDTWDGRQAAQTRGRWAVPAAPPPPAKALRKEEAWPTGQDLWTGPLLYGAGPEGHHVVGGAGPQPECPEKPRRQLGGLFLGLGLPPLT